MWNSAKALRRPEIPRGTRGLSLVELLVAMAIFIVLLGGLSVLLSGAISAVRTGYLNQESFERVRGSLTILERDLTNGFTAREYGDSYQFHGGPQGFAFVGVGENGGLTRVTYALHPTAETRSFRTAYAEQYGLLHRRAQEQGLRMADLTLLPQLVGLIGSQLPLTPDIDAPANMLPKDLYEAVVEFPEVVVETQGLVRYEQSGVGDLDAFEIRRADGTVIPWPYVDPEDPARDFAWRDAAPEQRDELLLYIHILDAVNPYVLPDNVMPPAFYESNVDDLKSLIDFADPNEDMRFVYRVTRRNLKMITRNVLEDIIRAKRREVWVRMLAGEKGLPEFWGNPSNPADVRPRAEDYVVTDAILYRMYTEQLPTFDIMGTPALFRYGDNVGNYVESFNSVARVTGYTDYADSPGFTSISGIDEGLARAVSSTVLSPEWLGTPLLPRLPGMVNPGFWLVVPARWVNAKDFVRWFAQDINVPTGAGRNMNSVLTRREQS